MKRLVLLLWGPVCLACSSDVFEIAPDGAPDLYKPPHLALQLTETDAAEETSLDASQIDASADVSPACPSLPTKDLKSALCTASLALCVGTDGGVDCNAPSNACAGQGELYAECFAPSDCSVGKVCAIVNQTVGVDSCAYIDLQGVSISCASPSYLNTFPKARKLCQTASDCGDAGTCMAREARGLLVGDVLGVCE